MGATDTSSPSRLAERFARLVDDLVHDHDRHHVLGVVASTATEVLPGCAWAAVIQVDGRGRGRTTTAGGPGGDVAALECGADDGPARRAARSATPVLVADVEDEGRWPDLARRISTTTPVRSVAAIRLRAEHVSDVLALYGSAPGAVVGRPDLLTAFAAQAHVLLRHAEALCRIDELTAAVSASREVGAATGIVMRTHGIAHDDAFDVLRRAAATMNVRISTLAALVVATGQAPLPPAETPDGGST